MTELEKEKINFKAWLARIAHKKEVWEKRIKSMEKKGK